MKRVFLLTGSNLGDSLNLLKKAETAIGNDLGTIVLKSHYYISGSWGYESSRNYINQCFGVDSDLDAYNILEKTLEIEGLMGRTRGDEKYSDREIDIDILFFGEKIIEDSRLTIPHPRLHLRKFALVPMNEIAGDFHHPVFKKTISELLATCPDQSVIDRSEENI